MEEEKDKEGSGKEEFMGHLNEVGRKVFVTTVTKSFAANLDRVTKSMRGKKVDAEALLQIVSLTAKVINTVAQPLTEEGAQKIYASLKEYFAEELDNGEEFYRTVSGELGGLLEKFGIKGNIRGIVIEEHSASPKRGAKKEEDNIEEKLPEAPVNMDKLLSQVNAYVRENTKKKDKGDESNA